MSTIVGVVKEFYITRNGYSGKIVDNSGNQHLFYLDEDNIETYEEEGLVPVLLNHSKETRTPLEMDTELSPDVNNILLVSHIKGTIDGQDYEV